MIEYIHPDLLPELTLEIAKPNREVIGYAENIYNRKQIIKLGQINEISFTTPYTIEKDYTPIKNPLISKLRSQYHIKATFGEQTEWFIVSNLNTSYTDDGSSYLNVQLKSLGYQLKNKKIRTWAGVLINGEYRKESLNAQQVLENILSTSAWSIGYIDSEFLTTFREFDFQGTSALDAVFNIAETFGAIIKWDTINKTISLIMQENAGVNKGFRISETNYLKTLEKEELSDEIVTRLHIYGKDGLSINNINPLGTDYLEDFSYYFQGFERDDNKNVISPSLYMSNGLCSALLDYQEAIKANEGKFKEYLDLKTQLLEEIIPFSNEIFKLETELKTILDVIDVKNSQGLDVSFELSEKERVTDEIKGTQHEIDVRNDVINDTDVNILNLQSLISIENNLTAEQIIELDDYISEETWEDQNYTSENDLFKDAQKVFEDLKKPKEIITTNIINLFKILDGKQDWKKVVIGDRFFIEYERLGIDVETQLIELEIDHDGTAINVTIANTKDIERDEDKLSKILYGSISTASTVDMSKYKWNQISSVQTDVSDILNNTWDANKREIVAGVNETVTINGRGITVTDSDDPLKYIRITNSVLGMTNDGGNTFKTGITPEGIIAETLLGKITITEQLFIENVAGKYSFTQDGMVIDGGSITITGGLPKSQLDPSFADDLVELNKDYTNGIRIDSEYGLLVTRSDDKTRAIFNATDGFKFQSKSGTNWRDDFYYDIANTRLVLNGELNATEIKLNGSSVLTENKLKISGTTIDKISTDQLVTGSAKITTAMIESLEVGKNVQMGANAVISWNNIGNKPFIPQSASDIGALSAGSPQLTYIDSSGVYTGTISANSIYGGTISGVTINVNTDLSVGNNIYLGGNGAGTKNLVFNSTQFIQSTADTMILGATRLDLSASYINFVGNPTVTGLNAVARFG